MAYEALQKLLEKRSKTYKDFADMIGRTQAVASNIFSGRRPLALEEAEKAARWLGTDLETVLYGEKPEVPVIGTIGPGEQVIAAGGQPLMPPARLGESGARYVDCECVQAPAGFYAAEVVALRIRGDAMEPFLEDGTLIFYHTRIHGDCDQYLNKLCVIGLKDGRVLVKKLKRGYSFGRYNLMSFNAKLIEDVEISWCAKVIDIRPA